MAGSIQVQRAERTIRAPLKFAYDWCTDFREDDHEITGETRRREIVEKTRRKVVYVYYWNDETGKQNMSVSIVSLKPPDAWRLDLFSKEENETGNYKLTRLGKNETKLRMVFKHDWKVEQNIPPVAEREERFVRRWDKYIEALESDYRKQAS